MKKQNILQKFLSLHTVIIFFLAGLTGVLFANSQIVGSALAEDTIEIRDVRKENDCTGELSEGNCEIIKLLNVALNFVSGGVALAVIGNIIYAGIQYSMAQGDPSGVSKSKKRIMDAVMAFIMYLALFAFIQWLIPGGVF